MSDQAIRVVVAGALLLHGLGHGGALAALAWLRLRPRTNTGAWTRAHTWLRPSLSEGNALAVAATLWVISMLGFVAAAAAFWGVILPTGAWQPLAVTSAVVSTAGIVLFLGNWPAFNTLAAMAVNGAVLVGLVVTGWAPPPA